MQGNGAAEAAARAQRVRRVGYFGSLPGGALAYTAAEWDGMSVGGGLPGVGREFVWVLER